MNSKRLFRFPAAVIALCCSLAGEVRANLFLSGDVVGIFHSDGGPNPDISRSADGAASFRTGIAAENSFKSGVTFIGGAFDGVGEGDTVSLGDLNYYNGITRAGTSSHSAVLDLYLRLADPSANWIHLTTLNFTIDATLNAKGREVPDNFLVKYNVLESAQVGGEWLEFGITGLPAATAVAENSKADPGNLMMTVKSGVPVPDNSNTLLLLALGVGLLIARDISRRWKLSKNLADRFASVLRVC